MTTYPGGKNGAGVWQKILNEMPPHRVYIEAFGGSFAVMRRKLPACLNIGIDRDGDVVRAILATLGERAPSSGPARPDPLAGTGVASGALATGGDAAGVLAGNGAVYRRAPTKTAIAAARARTGESRVSPESTREYSVSGSTLTGTGGPAATLNPSLVASRATNGEVRSAEFRFVCGDAIAFLRDYSFAGDELVYCDPPYVRSSRSTTRDIYRYEMTDVDHRRFLRVVMGLPCRVMISGYLSSLYAEALQDWRHVTFTGVTRGGPKTEYLWMNYPPVQAVHDPRFAGANWRERDRIRKMQRRWVARLERMDPLQRQALFAAIAGLDAIGDTRSAHANSGERTRLNSLHALSAPKAQEKD